MNYASSPAANSPMVSDEPVEDSQAFPQSRMFLVELGWRISVKIGSDREFCYNQAPGQEFYHRLLDGEVFLHRAEQKVCLACASRRGLISAEPRRLREAIIPLPADMDIIPLEMGPSDAEES